MSLKLGLADYAGKRRGRRSGGGLGRGRLIHSPDLEGLSGVGHSVEDYQAKWGMTVHVRLLEEEGLPNPLPKPRPRVIVEDAPAARRAG